MAVGDTLTIVANGDQAFTASFKGCKAVLAGNKTATNTTIALAWDGTEAYDTVGMHDPATNPSRFTIPVGLGGWWRYTVHVNAIGTGGAQAGEIDLYIDGSFVQSLDQRAFSSGVVHGLLATDVLSLVAGQYIEIYFGTGGSSVWRANSAGSYMAMEKISL